MTDYNLLLSYYMQCWLTPSFTHHCVYFMSTDLSIYVTMHHHQKILDYANIRAFLACKSRLSCICSFSFGRPTYKKSSLSIQFCWRKLFFPSNMGLLTARLPANVNLAAATSVLLIILYVALLAEASSKY